MEAKTKIMAAVAVIVMCAAGLVGAGYAYTASTTNTGNSAGAEYITLVQGEAGAYNFSNGEKVYWDSQDYKEGVDMKTKYTLSDFVETTPIVDYSVVKLGKSFTLNPVFSDDEDLPNITVAITGNAAFDLPTKPDTAEIWIKTTTNTDQYQYFKLTNDDGVFTEYTHPQSTWVPGTGANISVVKNNGNTAYLPITVDVYYGWPTTAQTAGYIVTHTSGNVSENAPQTDILSGASLTFSIAVNKANGFYLDIAAGEVTVDGSTLAIHATLPTGWSATHLTWTSSDGNKATVAGNGTVTGTVTAVAEGDVTITADYNDSGTHYTVTCTVHVNAA